MPIFGPEGPEIGDEGAVLENFGKFSKKVAEKCNKIQFWEKFWILEKIFRIPLVNRPKNGFLWSRFEILTKNLFFERSCKVILNLNAQNRTVFIFKILHLWFFNQ